MIEKDWDTYIYVFSNRERACHYYFDFKDKNRNDRFRYQDNLLTVWDIKKRAKIKISSASHRFEGYRVSDFKIFIDESFPIEKLAKIELGLNSCKVKR